MPSTGEPIHLRPHWHSKSRRKKPASSVNECCHGLAKLRIVDAAIIDDRLEHINSPVIMIAEKAAESILSEA
ncbi:hypothetical protein [Rhizobium binxianense]|uniref:hypothetical protein n=1 Tax=Rhizobium binxianense TaxID=3024242 RepID=UPI00235E97E2|nr:hypothetical protein [Rhizobium sp. MJ37]MDC9837300.1 hypothetical protein [Rhizobium sp. MJ37]